MYLLPSHGTWTMPWVLFTSQCLDTIFITLYYTNRTTSYTITENNEVQCMENVLILVVRKLAQRKTVARACFERTMAERT